MIMSNIYVIFFYLMSFVLFFNISSPFVFWMTTELNLMMFIMMMVSLVMNKFKQEIYDLVLFYFFIQSLSSMLILSDFFLSEDFFLFNSDSLFISAMLIKLGIFPFFYWIFKISDFLSLLSLWILLTLQKIPFLLFLFSNLNSLLPSLVFFSFLSGSVLVVYSFTLVSVLVSSSIMSTLWIFYMFEVSVYLFFFYFLIYGFFLYLLLNFFFKNMENSSTLFPIMLFSFLLGVSPMGMFFFKVLSIDFMVIFLGSIELILFWFFSFIALFGYMKFSYTIFFSSFSFYLIRHNLSFCFFFFFSIFFFFSFFCY